MWNIKPAKPYVKSELEMSTFRHKNRLIELSLQSTLLIISKIIILVLYS